MFVFVQSDWLGDFLFIVSLHFLGGVHFTGTFDLKTRIKKNKPNFCVLLVVFLALPPLSPPTSAAKYCFLFLT